MAAIHAMGDFPLRSLSFRWTFDGTDPMESAIPIVNKAFPYAGAIAVCVEVTDGWQTEQDCGTQHVFSDINSELQMRLE